jgi:serine/threonine protein kinase
MHTGQLDTARLNAPREYLTPAADIYSLAKTTYTLLAGESPRRFAQHTITDLPSMVDERPWSNAVLRVLERATQNRPEDRYQTVEEFWDDFAEATLPPTRPLHAFVPEMEPRRKPSEDLSLLPEEFTEAAPPRPQFTPPATNELPAPTIDSLKRPRIVVPISLEAQRQMELQTRQEAVSKKTSLTGRKPPLGGPKEVTPASRGRRALVALGLVLAFSGMLLATHKYVTSHWNPLSSVTQVGESFAVGKEGVTTTDVNLRPMANTINAPIGIAESGSRVKVLSIAENNWVEVQVVAHGRPKTDPYSSDRGWINRRFVRFE